MDFTVKEGSREREREREALDRGEEGREKRFTISAEVYHRRTT